LEQEVVEYEDQNHSFTKTEKDCLDRSIQLELVKRIGLAVEVARGNPSFSRLWERRALSRWLHRWERGAERKGIKPGWCLETSRCMYRYGEKRLQALLW
jgi:esterase/lipase superfamily enzyme